MLFYTGNIDSNFQYWLYGVVYFRVLQMAFVYETQKDWDFRLMWNLNYSKIKALIKIEFSIPVRNLNLEMLHFRIYVLFSADRTSKMIFKLPNSIFASPFT